MANVRFGSLAALHPDITRTSAFERKADVQSCGPLCGFASWTGNKDGGGGRISPSALRAPVALAADRDAPASLRLRVNLLLCRFKTCSLPNKKADPDGAGFLFGSGGRIWALLAQDS